MASSPERTAANRENARRSTGPRTPEGKHRARRNGLTHGHTATAMLLDDEDPQAWEALVEATLADLGPRSEHERTLAVNVANTLWRRERLYRAETAFLNVRSRAIQAENPEVRSTAEATAMLLMDADDINRMRLLSRYLNGAERACTRAAEDYWAARNALLRSELEEAQTTDALIERNYNAAVAELDGETTIPDPTPMPELVPAEAATPETCPPTAPDPTPTGAPAVWKPFDDPDKTRDYVWLAKHGGLPDHISSQVLAWEATR